MPPSTDFGAVKVSNSFGAVTVSGAEPVKAPAEAVIKPDVFAATGTVLMANEAVVCPAAIITEDEANVAAVLPLLRLAVKVDAMGWLRVIVPTLAVPPGTVLGARETESVIAATCSVSLAATPLTGVPVIVTVLGVFTTDVLIGNV